MIVQQIFPSFVAVDYLKEIDNSAIKEFCYQNEQNSLSISDERIGSLISIINDRLIGIKNMYGLRNDVDTEVVNGWVNINRPGAFLHNKPPHLHTHYFMSAVYYVTAPKNGGNLTFVAPFTGLEYTVPRGAIGNDTVYNSSRWSIEPEEGKLIIFPSWLLHYVNDNRSQEDRVSMAFNIGGLTRFAEYNVWQEASNR
jgi:hypothetical protein